MYFIPFKYRRRWAEKEWLRGIPTYLSSEVQIIPDKWKPSVNYIQAECLQFSIFKRKSTYDNHCIPESFNYANVQC